MENEGGRSPLGIRKTNWLRLAIALAGVACLKAAFIWLVLPWAAEQNFIPTVSAAHDLYIDIARNLASGQGFRVTTETAETMMRGPGYPYFLAFLIHLFGENQFVIQTANIMLGLGTAAIVFVLTQMLTGSAVVSLLSAAIFAFHPAVLLLETRIGLEGLFTFLLALFVLLLYRALDNERLVSFFLAGVCLGFVLLTRTTPLLIIGLLFLYLLILYRQSQPWRKASTQTGILVLGVLMILSPWMLRNYNLTGTPTFSESLSGVAAFQGSYVTKTMGDGRSYKARFHEARRVQSELAAANGVQFIQLKEEKNVRYWDLFYSIHDELDYNKVLLKYVLDEYKGEPFLLLKHGVYNAVRFWFQGSSPVITWLGAILMVPILLLAITGLVLGLRRGLRVIPLTLPIMAVYMVSIPLISNARYAIPLMPFLAILIGVALNEARSVLSETRRERVAQN